MPTLFYFEAKLKIGKEEQFFQFVNGLKALQSPNQSWVSFQQKLDYRKMMWVKPLSTCRRNGKARKTLKIIAKTQSDYLV